MEEHDVLREFLDYQMRFVEQKGSWSNFRICPYAKKYREDGRILYKVLPFDETTILEEPCLSLCKEFAGQSHYLAMLFIHPDKEAMCYSSLEALAHKIAQPMHELGIEPHTGHPQHQLKVNGTYLRREPFITLQFLHTSLSKRATRGLNRAHYYDQWDGKSLEYINFKDQFKD